MDAVRASPVFSVEGKAFTWADLIALAREWGEWQPLEQQARVALAAARQADEGGSSPSEKEVTAAATVFRRAHNLLSADDLTRWTARWGFSTQDWLRYVRRSLISTDKVAPAADLSEAELEQATWIHAVCSGAIADLAGRAAERAAVGVRIGAGEFASVDELQRFCVDQVNDHAIDNEIRSRAVGLAHLRYRYVIHADEVVLREAVLCVNEDGREFDEVAADAALEITHHEGYLEDADPSVQRYLLAAGQGDVVGPVRVTDGHWLAQVVDREPARTTDDAVRARVGKGLRERALRAEVNTAVTWHEHF